MNKVVLGVLLVTILGAVDGMTAGLHLRRERSLPESSSGLRSKESSPVWRLGASHVK
jgi:hypothetical protein